MDFNRFTEKLQEAFRSAQSLAANRGNQQIDVEHLLVALLEQESGLAQSILARADVKLEDAHRRLIQELDKLPKVSGSGVNLEQIHITARLQKLLTAAETLASALAAFPIDPSGGPDDADDPVDEGDEATDEPDAD